MVRLTFILALLIPTACLAQPAEVNRVLRTFDFEERRLGNAEDLPMNWTKVEGAGLPHYVNGSLTTDRARSGKYSFRFDLNGGSLIYRYDAGRIRVQAGAHYRVEAYVRTTPLANARARLSAYMVDADGAQVPATVRHSELYAAQWDEEPWHKVWVELSAATSKEASLVIELSLLQPQFYAGSSLGRRTLFGQDIRGSAWFDDVTVSQVPRVKMSTDRPGNVFRRSEALRLQVVVSDRFTDDLAAQVLVHDATGRKAYQRSGSLDIATAETLGPGRKRVWVVLPDELPPGWYETSLVMTSRGQYLGEQRLALVRLADDAPINMPDERFGVVATDLPFAGWGELPDLLPLLNTGRVKLAVWSSSADVEELDPAAFDNLLVRLQELRIRPTACLLDLPPAIARKFQMRRRMDDAARAMAGAVRGPVGDSNWPDLLKADPEDWRPQLSQLVARHANHLDRWQIGADGTDAFVTQPGMRAVYDRVYKEFDALTFKPDLAMPWPAWYELDGTSPATVAMSVPTSVLPAQLPLYVQDVVGRDGHALSITLAALDRRPYGRDVQIRDFAQRVTYALAAGAQRIDLPLPFTVRAGSGTGAADDVEKQPQELLMVQRTLVTTLAGAAYKGRAPIAEGVEAFLFDRAGQGIIVMWDRGTTPGVKEMAVNLGERPRRVDLWGNVTPLLVTTDARGAGTAQLALGAMPILLVDVDAQVAMFRASVAIDRPLIESSFTSHARHLRFSNPYKTAIAGSVKLKAPAGWTLTPPTQNFSLNPGETFDAELTIQFPYNSYAGTKTIEAQFALQADRTSTFTVPLTLQLGLSDVGMQALALRDGDDVIVQQTIQNYGDKAIDYGAFAIFPGQARQERLVTNLGAGRATLKRYRFEKAKVPPGTKIRVGVKELNGTRILNDEVEVQ